MACKRKSEDEEDCPECPKKRGVAALSCTDCSSSSSSSGGSSSGSSDIAEDPPSPSNGWGGGCEGGVVDAAAKTPLSPPAKGDAAAEIVAAKKIMPPQLQQQQPQQLQQPQQPQLLLVDEQGRKGTITEYFRSQMKPTNNGGLMTKTNLDAWMMKTNRAGDNLEKCIAYLSRNIVDDSPKIARKSTPIVPKTPRELKLPRLAEKKKARSVDRRRKPIAPKDAVAPKPEPPVAPVAVHTPEAPPPTHNISIPSHPNQQFVLPLVQNHHLIQMPLHHPHHPHQNHHHQQLFSILKLNGLAKHLNGYAVAPKSVPPPPPTVNLNAPFFVSSPGFFVNSVGVTGNVVLVPPPNGAQMPMPQLNRVFITQQQQQQHHQQHHQQQQQHIFRSHEVVEETTTVRVTTEQTTTTKLVTTRADESLSNHSVPKLNSIVDSIISRSSVDATQVERCKEPVEVPRIPREPIVAAQDDSEESKTNGSPPETPESKELDEDRSTTSSTATSPTPTESPVTVESSTRLSEPTTIRFPFNEKLHQQVQRGRPARSSAPAAVETRTCQWSECLSTFDDGSDLLEHLQECHVKVQSEKETFSCLWTTCKVYNRPSCSRGWLERHVLSHGGTKLFRCIVDGCGQRFNSHLALQRHVNNHFSENPSSVSSAKKSIENNGSAKLVRRNGKKLRYRRQPWSARLFDYFDPGIMEGLQYRVVQTALWRSGSGVRSTMEALYANERSPHCIRMVARTIARRINSDSLLPECLVQWSPSNVLQDEWLPEKDFVPVREVKFSSLDAGARCVLYSSFCQSYRSTANNERLPAMLPPTRTTPKPPRLNGFRKPPPPPLLNGKITLDTTATQQQHSHNNISKTDRLNTTTTQEQESEAKRITGAAKRKMRRRF